MVSHSDMTLWVLSTVHQERKKGREEGGMEDKEGRRKPGKRKPQAHHQGRSVAGPGVGGGLRCRRWTQVR